MRGEAEERILKSLEQKTDFDFTETPLADVIDYFKSKHKIEIQIDLKALTDEAVDTSAPVTRALKDITLKATLRLILRDLNLTYIVRDEMLMITTKTEADATLETRMYPVADLLSRWPAGALTLGDLASTITATVQPSSWEAGTGPLTQMQVVPGTLVISQTQDVHEDIAKLLALLRRVKKAQVAEKGAAEAEQPAAGDARPAAKPMRIAVYRVPRIDGEGLKTAIISLIAPNTWKENGGEGSIQLVRGASEEKPQEKKERTDKPAPAAGSAAPVRTAQFGGGGGLGGGGISQPTQHADLLVVRQTDEVHAAIEDLLHDVYSATVGPGGGAIAGGGGGLFNIRP